MKTKIDVWRVECLKIEVTKNCLVSQLKKSRLMASSPIISWQIDGESVEGLTDFICLGFKKSLWMVNVAMKLKKKKNKKTKKKQLLLGRKAMTNLDSALKSKCITLLTKVRLVKGMVFPVGMYGYESWTIKRAEHRRIDAFEMWFWRRLLGDPWTAKRSNQSILKAINLKYLFEGLMLKLKL